MSGAIQFDHVGKLYRLGLVGTGTLSHDLNRWWQTKVLRHEDPYLKVGEVNDRAHKGKSDYVWALKDITFDVGEGDIVGIIGKNGAGKSTLLKLLSRVTSPTTGTIRAKGRIASLLEVGTGFHGEMTGRENIYMNGSILGMTRPEINRKLDDIIGFAGVERYIDTPVKRYSSGMTVRLGFAVAAFLEPEILVVDEVLAVGDAEFQKKAIGKMQDVSRGEGRTVLFVSHNMAAIRSLCHRGIVLDNGEVSFDGIVEDSINHYLSTAIMTLKSHASSADLKRKHRLGRELELTDVRILNDVENISTSETLVFELSFIRNVPSVRVCQFGVLAKNEFDSLIWASYSSAVSLPETGKEFSVRVSVPGHNSPRGRYNLNFNISSFEYTSAIKDYDIICDSISFEVKFVDSDHTIPFAFWPFKNGTSVQDSLAELI